MATLKKSVTLNPGESKIVTFTFTPTVAKTYYVSVDGLTGSFVAVEVPAAQFEASDLVIALPQLYVGDKQSISAVVTNVGGKAGSYEVVLEVI